MAQYSLLDNPNMDRTGQFDLSYDNPDLASFLQGSPDDFKAQGDDAAAMSKFYKGMATIQDAAQTSTTLQKMFADMMGGTQAMNDELRVLKNPGVAMPAEDDDLTQQIIAMLIDALGVEGNTGYPSPAFDNTNSYRSMIIGPDGRNWGPGPDGTLRPIGSPPTSTTTTLPRKPRPFTGIPYIDQMLGY